MPRRFRHVDLPARGVLLAARAAVVVPVLAAVALLAAGLTGRIHAGVAGFVAGGLLVLAGTLLPRRHRAPAPVGLALPTEHPLAAIAAEEAEAIGAAAPAEVRVVLDHETRVMRTDRGRVLLAGMPQLAGRSAATVRVAVAAALAQDADGVRRRLLALEAHLAERLAERGPRWLAAVERVHPHVLHVLRTRDARLAGALAARFGREAADGVLRDQVRTGAFAAFWDEEVGPCLTDGFLPPVVAGWQRYVAVPAIAERLGSAIATAMAGPLAASAAAVADAPLTAAEIPAPERERVAPIAVPGPELERAILAEVAPLAVPGPELERAILAATAAAGSARQLVPISWQRVGEAVVLERCRRELPAEPPATVAGLAAAAAQADDAGRARLGASLALALHEAGWDLHQLPGEPLVAEHDDTALVPLVVPYAIAEPLEAEAWATLAADLELDDLPLPGRAVAWAGLTELPTQAPPTPVELALAPRPARPWRRPAVATLVLAGAELQVEHPALREPWRIAAADLRGVVVDAARPDRRFPVAVTPWGREHGWLWTPEDARRLPAIAHSDQAPNLLLVLAPDAPAPLLRRGRGDGAGGVLLTVADPAAAERALAARGLVRALGLDDARRLARGGATTEVVA